MQQCDLLMVQYQEHVFSHLFYQIQVIFHEKLLLLIKPAKSVHGGIQLFFIPPGEGEAGAISQFEQCSLVDNFFDKFSENIR